jgi:hypothetical protein
MPSDAPSDGCRDDEQYSDMDEHSDGYSDAEFEDEAEVCVRSESVRVFMLPETERRGA